MRSTRSTSVVVCLFLFPAAPVSAEDARAVLERAIRAHGGEARLERTKKGRIKSEMEGQERGNVFKVAREEIFDLPARYRRTIDGTVNGKPLRLEYAVTGNHYWIHELEDTRKGQMKSLPLGQHWQAVLAQLPLLRGKDTQLTSLPDRMKDGRTLAGIRVASPKGAADFYFDKSTGLLTRSQWALPSFVADQEMMGENLYEDYRDIQGVRYPMKVKAAAGNDQSVIVVVSTVEFLDKIEDSVFANPYPPAAQAREGAAPKTNSETKPSSGDSRDDEETPGRRDPWLIVATLSAGAAIGAVWFLVRASKRGKPRRPPS